LVPEDRCHLNGLAVAGGRPAYVTAAAESDTRQGWRAVKGTGGCVIDVASGETAVRGLCMPHSPRLSGGRLYLVDSGTGRLVAADVAGGRGRTGGGRPGLAPGPGRRGPAGVGRA